MPDAISDSVQDPYWGLADDERVAVIAAEIHAQQQWGPVVWMLIAIAYRLLIGAAR